MKSRSFSASHAALLVSRLGGSKELEGDRTTDPRDIPHHKVPCSVYKPGGKLAKATAWEMVGHWSASGGQLHCATFVLYILSILSLLLLLFSLSY